MHGNGTKSYVFFTALILVFLMPIVITWIALSQKNKIREFHLSTLANTFFMNPMVPLSALNFANLDGTNFDSAQLRGNWTLMYVNALSCYDEHSCQHYFNKAQTVQKTLQQKHYDISTVVVSYGSPSYPFLHHLVNNSGISGTQLAILTENNYLKPDHFYIADVFGNIILSYAKNTKEQQIIADIEPLIKLSPNF